MITKKEILIAASVIAILPNIALAYIDPASGSAIMSAVIGIFVATGIFVKTFWYKIKNFFCPANKKQDISAQAATAADEQAKD